MNRIHDPLPLTPIFQTADTEIEAQMTGHGHYTSVSESPHG